MTVRAGEIVAWRTWFWYGGVLRSTTVQGAYVDEKTLVFGNRDVRTIGPGQEWRDGLLSSERAPREECACPLRGDKLCSIARDTRCRCGIYAHATEEQARAHAWSIRATRWTKYDAEVHVGRVALWGTVHEHQRGYRAEHARALDHAKFDGVPTVPGWQVSGVSLVSFTIDRKK